MFKSSALAGTIARAVRFGVISCGVFLLVASMGACDGILDVDNESDILDQDLDDPQAIGPVVAGVAGDFGTFYSQMAHAVALASFELWHTGSHGHDRETDEGFLARPASDGNTGYNNASRAIWVAQDAQRRLRNVFDDADAREEMAEVVVWSGFTMHMLADNFCQATFDAGPPVSPDEVRRMAEDRFSEALAAANAAGSQKWRLRALAGRARARLMLGDHAGAIADAQQIPQGFLFPYVYSANSGRENNYYAGHTRDRFRRETGIHPRYFEDERYLNDPRTPWVDWGEDAVGPDAIRRWVEQDKYRDRDSNMLVSSWQEVRLIEAEAWIGMGDLEKAVALMNDVRAYVELPPYDGPLTRDAVLDQLIYERSAELWLQGQQLLDLRRFDSPLLDVAPGRGGFATRGDCWEIGEDEYLTNPNLGG